MQTEANNRLANHEMNAISSSNLNKRERRKIVIWKDASSEGSTDEEDSMSDGEHYFIYEAYYFTDEEDDLTDEEDDLTVVEESTVVDEDDYLTVCELIKENNPKPSDDTFLIEENEERRIVKLRIDSSYTFMWAPSLCRLEALTHLTMSHCKFKSIPDSIGELQNLIVFDLSDAENLQNLPDAIGKLCNLCELYLQRSGVTSLPSSIGGLQNLTHLYLSGCSHLQNLPVEMENLKSLEILWLHYCWRIRSIPVCVCRLPKIKEIVLSQSITDDIGNLNSSLEELSLYKLQSLLSSSIGRLTNLTYLQIGHCDGMSALPDEIGDLASLRHLALNDNEGLESLPPSIGRLSHLEWLRLQNSKHLSTLPEEIGNLTNLEMLNLKYLGTTSLPCSIGRLSHLKYLDIENLKQLSTLPKEIGDLTNLMVLNLKDLGTISIPEEIGDLTNLNVLNLKNSGITSLPPSIGGLKNLHELQLKGTAKLRNLPQEIKNLVELLVINERGSSIPVDVMDEVRFGIGCSKARVRIGTGMAPNLWPVAVDNAILAFRFQENRYQMKKEDAVYQLLLLGRASLVQLLLHRTNA